MPFRHGKNTNFQIGTAGAPATPTDISQYLVEVQYPRTVDVAETTTFSTSTTGVDKTYLVGLRDATISVIGLYDPAVDAILAAILGLDGQANGLGFAYIYGPEGSIATRTKYSGNAHLSAYGPTNPVGDRVSWTATFQNNGLVTRGAF